MGLLEEMEITLKLVGSVMVTEVVAVQPLSSVTTTE
jgi:hypothetical protein